MGSASQLAQAWASSGAHSHVVRLGGMPGKLAQQVGPTGRVVLNGWARRLAHAGSISAHTGTGKPVSGLSHLTLHARLFGVKSTRAGCIWS
ncbi:hypothetical protein TIFTF001_006943 [Ficus carica]|uniref:Uncharacterized protein n=1 Tax=Ficus carica TaxID=3494 RepID=A0AA87ZQF2_FICCA|nr:hypothetical protein TIFTF001_006943 [Ficus carica]